jgi:hypothetical protein
LPALHALVRLYERDPASATTLALSAEIGSNVELAERLLQPFVDEVAFSKLSVSEVKCLLAKLESTQTIEGHNLSQFLARGSNRNPDVLLGFLFARIGRERPSSREYYSALPFRHSDVFDIEFPAEARERLLTKVCEEAGRTDWPRLEHLSELFRLISADLREPAVFVLMRFTQGADERRLEAAVSLIDGGSDFILKNDDFNHRVLHQAMSLGPDVYERVRRKLASAIRPRVRLFTPGEVSAEDIAIRDRARKLASNPATDPLCRPLYEDIAREAAVDAVDLFWEDDS